MAGSFSDYLEGKLLDLTFGAQAFSAPATIYAALFTATPSDSGGGTEVSGGDYARVAITNNSTNFPNEADTVTTKLNGTTITFPTASANWGTVTQMGFFDASTAGNLLCWADLTASQAINTGATASFAASAITITLS